MEESYFISGSHCFLAGLCQFLSAFVAFLTSNHIKHICHHQILYSNVNMCRTLTLSAWYFKFLCAVDFTARLSNQTRISANFMAHAVCCSNSVWWHAIIIIIIFFFILSPIISLIQKKVIAPSGEVRMYFRLEWLLSMLRYMCPSHQHILDVTFFHDAWPSKWWLLS